MHNSSSYASYAETTEIITQMTGVLKERGSKSITVAYVLSAVLYCTVCGQGRCYRKKLAAVRRQRYVSAPASPKYNLGWDESSCIAYRYGE